MDVGRLQAAQPAREGWPWGGKPRGQGTGPGSATGPAPGLRLVSTELASEGAAVSHAIFQGRTSLPLPPQGPPQNSEKRLRVPNHPAFSLHSGLPILNYLPFYTADPPKDIPSPCTRGKCLARGGCSSCKQ